MTEKDRLAVLIVDDDTVFHDRLRRAFEVRGWEAHVAASGKEALTRARDAGPDLAIVDLRMRGESGLISSKICGNQTRRSQSSF